MRRWLNTISQAAILTFAMAAVFLWVVALASPENLYLTELGQ
jgi:hypothetical protein